MAHSASETDAVDGDDVIEQRRHRKADFLLADVGGLVVASKSMKNCLICASIRFPWLRVSVAAWRRPQNRGGAGWFVARAEKKPPARPDGFPQQP